MAKKKIAKSEGKTAGRKKTVSTAAAAKSKTTSRLQPVRPAAETPKISPAKSSKIETTPITSEFIGEAAGAIWGILSADGPQTLAQLKKSVDAPADTVLAAVGWLAREGKLNFDNSANAVTVSLA